MRRLACAIALAVLALPAAPAVALWLSAGGGWNTYAMRDVNGDIGAINAFAPVSLKELKGGADLELGGGAPVGRWLDVGASYERLWASTSPNRGSGGSEYDLPAEIYKATLFHTFPSASPDVLGLSVSLGLVRCAGGAALRNVDVGTSVGQGGVSGTGPFAEGALTAGWRIAGRTSLTAAVGYRYARIGKVEVAGQTAYRDDGRQYAVDYSGLAVRAAIRIDLASRRAPPAGQGTP